MQITRVYTGDDGESHFETIDVALSESRYGELSEMFDAEGVIFRTTPVGGELDFPQRARDASSWSRSAARSRSKSATAASCDSTAATSCSPTM